MMTMTTAIAKLLEDSSERMSVMQHQQAKMNAELAKTQAELNLKAIAAVSASSRQVRLRLLSILPLSFLSYLYPNVINIIVL